MQSRCVCHIDRMGTVPMSTLRCCSCHQLQLYHAAVSMISQGVVSCASACLIYTSRFTHSPSTALMVLRTYALYNFDPRVPMLFVAFTLIGGSTTTVSSPCYVLPEYSRSLWCNSGHSSRRRAPKVNPSISSIQPDASWCSRNLSKSLIRPRTSEALILIARAERESPYFGAWIQARLMPSDKVTLLRGA